MGNDALAVSKKNGLIMGQWHGIAMAVAMQKSVLAWHVQTVLYTGGYR